MIISYASMLIITQYPYNDNAASLSPALPIVISKRFDRTTLPQMCIVININSRMSQKNSGGIKVYNINKQ